MVIILKEIAVVLLADIVVRDTEYETAAPCASDCQHTIVEQQAREYLRVSHIHSREGSPQVSHNLSLFNHLHQHSLAVAVQLVHLNEFLEFAVVGPGVVVQHFLRSVSKIDVMP